MITCIQCQKFSLQRVEPEHARKGLGHCSLRATFIRHDANKERDCEEFRQEADDVVTKRIQWLKNAERKA